jgi:hypothetical protein
MERALSRTVSGRTVNFTTKPVGLGRFELEFKD